jgi:hypothetical protein
MINRQWTTFEGRAYGRSHSEQIRVTLNERGVFYLNKPAFEVMGGPAAVEMKYDGNRRIIGLKPVDPRRKNAFLLKQHSVGNYRKVNAAVFCKHFRLRIEGTNLFDGAEFTFDGILELPLDSMITVGRGAR